MLAHWFRSKRTLLELSDVRILLRLAEKDNARYSELLSGVVKSRSTLTNPLSQLQIYGLIEREVKQTQPVQTTYTLTEKGRIFVSHLVEIRD
ncbi:MAG: winged helix-turn-helix transcriptional regulator [Nitrososphaerota archaeon]|jgi:DNA-binding HxlR family transcriptional regulator|nr:winged helix-turn-helix transcriptional regulator [Nitrososphaerota archaeon]